MPCGHTGRRDGGGRWLDGARGRGWLPCAGHCGHTCRPEGTRLPSSLHAGIALPGSHMSGRPNVGPLQLLAQKWPGLSPHRRGCGCCSKPLLQGLARDSPISSPGASLSCTERSLCSDVSGQGQHRCRGKFTGSSLAQLRPERQRGLRDSSRSPSWAHIPDSPRHLRPHSGFWMSPAYKQTAGPMATAHSQEHPRASDSKSPLPPVPQSPACLPSQAPGHGTPPSRLPLCPWCTLGAKPLAQRPAPPPAAPWGYWVGEGWVRPGLTQGLLYGEGPGSGQAAWAQQECRGAAVLWAAAAHRPRVPVGQTRGLVL